MTRLRLVTGETFKSLSVRNFRLFFVGQGISQIGNWLTLVAQTLLVLTLTKSGIALGVLAAAQFGPVLILGPWAGLVADRSDKRKLLMTVQTIAMFQSFALATLAFIGNPPVLAVYGVALIGGVTIAFDNPARRSFVVEMVPTDDMTNAVSLNSALMTSSRVIGPALAGLLVTTVGFGWAFLLDGLSYIAVLISLFMIRSNELNAAPVTPKAKGQVRAGLRYARSVPDLWVPLVMMAIVGTLSFNFQVVFPLVVTRDFGGNDASFTILLSVVSVGSLIGALAAARRKAVSIRWVALTAVIFGAALTLMAFAPSMWAAYPIGLFVGLGSIAFMTASTAIMQIRSDPQMRGRVLALQAMVFLGSTPIGGPIVGWIAEEFGARWSVGVGAVGALGAGLWGLSVARRTARDAVGSAAADPDLLAAA
ncbi:MAG: MFS transporter [Acidimicrobiales bacterium]